MFTINLNHVRLSLTSTVLHSLPGSPATANFVLRYALGLPTMNALRLHLAALLASAASALAQVSINPASKTFGQAGGAAAITTNAATATPWTATTDAPWVKFVVNGAAVTTASGTTPTQVVYTVDSNGTADTRSATITINPGSLKHTITQVGYDATLTPASGSFAQAGGTGSLSVTLPAGVTWTAIVNDAWLSVTAGASGSGNGSVSYTVAPYNDVTTRTGTITIAGKTFSVSQTGVDVALNPAGITAPNGSGVQLVQVSALSFTTWIPQPQSPWISVVDAGSGAGSGAITVAYSSNPSYLPRTGTVKVGSATFSIVQAGNPNPVVSISPSASSADPAGAVGIINVQATPNAPWTAEAASSWLIISEGATGTGDGKVKFVATPNPGTNTRSGTLIVKGPPPLPPDVDWNRGRLHSFGTYLQDKANLAVFLSGNDDLYPTFDGTKSVTIAGTSTTTKDTDEWAFLLTVQPAQLATINRLLSFVPGDGRELQLWLNETGNPVLRVNGGAGASTTTTTGLIVDASKKFQILVQGDANSSQLFAAASGAKLTKLADVVTNGAIFPKTKTDGLDKIKLGYTTLPSAGNFSGSLALEDIWGRVLTATELGSASGVPKVGDRWSIISSNLGWWDAEANARSSARSRLAVIRSRAENLDVVKSSKGSGWTQYAWIGLTEAGGNNWFHWIDGTFVGPMPSTPAGSWTNWSSGNPDNTAGREHYVVLQNDGKWNDAGDGAISHYITESRLQPKSSNAAREFYFSGSGTEYSYASPSRFSSRLVLTADRFGRASSAAAWTSAQSLTESFYPEVTQAFSAWQKLAYPPSPLILYRLFLQDGVTSNFGSIPVRAPGTEVQLKLGSDGALILTDGAGVESFRTAAGVLAANQWEMLGFTRDSVGVIRLYVDGIEVGNTSAYAAKFANNVRWQRIVVGGYEGQFDDFIVYNTTMSSAQMKAAYDAAKPVQLVYTVTQAPQPSSFDPAAASVSSSGGTATLNLKAASSVAWTATSSSPWLAITSGGSGAGNGTITVSAPANSSVYPRTATISAAGASLTVTQPGRTVSVSPLIPAAIALDGTTGVSTISVNAEAGATWAAVSNAPWLTVVTGASGAGSGVVTYVATIYDNTLSSRTGTLTVAGQAVYITQRGYTLTVSPNGTQLGAAANTSSLSITAPLTAVWQALASVPWITINGSTSGNGSGTLTYSVAENKSGTVRTGQIIVSGEAYSVSQAATTDTAPVITTQPTSQTVTVGQTATFSVAASGSPTPTFQWLKNGVAITGATSPQLALSNVQTVDAGNYQVSVSNRAGTVASTVAGLTVNNPAAGPVFTVQPSPFAGVSGGSASFSVVVSSTKAISYQWYFVAKGGTTAVAVTDASGKRTGSKTAVLSISSLNATDEGDYVCTVTDGTATVNSVSAALSLATRIMSVGRPTAAPGATVVVPISLTAAGNENTITFSLQFDAAKLTYVSEALGSDATGATLFVNVEQKTAGKLGFLVGKAPSQTFSAGQKAVLNVTFTVSSGVAGGEIIPIAFSDLPSTRKVIDAVSTTLTAAFNNGAVTAVSGLEGDLNNDGVVDGADWVKLGRIVVGLDPVPTGLNFMRADAAPKSTKGDGVIDGGDWVQVGRWVVGLDATQAAGGPTTPQQ